MKSSWPSTVRRNLASLLVKQHAVKDNFISRFNAPGRYHPEANSGMLRTNTATMGVFAEIRGGIWRC